MISPWFSSGRERGVPDDRHPHPRKRLGQHFLVDRHALGRIADALELTGKETVIEIGPGRGALTDLLVERAARVIAIELDRDLVPKLRARYAGKPHVEIVEADVLDVSLGAIAGGDYVLAGNVPYYITTPILFHSLEPPRPARAVFLVQLEVAERMASPPGSKQYGALSANLQAIAMVQVVGRVPPGSFRPPPAVDSAIVRVRPRPDPLVPLEDEARFHRFVQAVFGLRRKQLRRILRTVLNAPQEVADRILAEAEIDPEARPETLSPAELARVERIAAAQR
jgi:16S rRNA (adenine1518-N6/adenine1519-N6)-dimethyltransferase